MSVLCCGEADESNGAEHAVWCQSYDLAADYLTDRAAALTEEANDA